MTQVLASKTWPTVELGEVVELKYGKSLPKSSRSGSGYPVYGSNGEVGRHEIALTTGVTIVVGRKGSHGAVNFSASACWPIDTTYFVDETCTSADLGWLKYRLTGLRLDEMNKAAAVPGLNREDAYRQKLLLPPIEEQRRIAAILDAADALRAKRRQALAKLDTLTQAIFIDMFGGDWEQFQFVDVAALAMEAKGSIRTGPFGSQLLHEEFVASGVAVLGIDNAVHNTFAWGKRRFITEEKYEHLKRFTVRPGDVLVTIMGTCGRVAVVPQDIPTSINTKHLCCITLNPELCLPEWLQAALLFHPRVLRQLGATHGAVMPGLNMGLIKGAEIPLPTLALQRQFVSQSASVLSQMTDTDSSMKSLDDLFASLQQRAFRGDL